MKRNAIVLIGTALLGVGCGLLEDPTPDEARLVIQGETNKPVRVIISKEFVAQVNQLGQTEVVMFEADTLVTSLPYETVHTIEEHQRFFAEASRLDADLETVQMQVFIDGRRQFDEGGRLLENRPFRFVYTFNQATTREIVIL